MSTKGNGSSKCRIGLFICHCGTNISKMVDVVGLAEEFKKHPDVVVSKEYKFMCSEPGQELIIKEIKENNLDRVVVAACSPLMHEPTFRTAVERGGMNRYFFEMVNIREQVSWVTTDYQAATNKARMLIRGALARVKLHEPLEMRRISITRRVMIVGGGIAGIEAALQIADAGYEVILVEKEESIGGHMAKFDKTFPTLDCAACILTPKMVSVGKHPNIRLMTFAEVEDVSGYIGNFKIKVRKKARFVDPAVCNSCGTCYEACPSQPYPLDRALILGGKVFKEGRRLKPKRPPSLGPEHDLTVLTGAQPMPEQKRKPEGAK
ncbi:CoB--CoM heterodisulfide reductase iron-sulfur subunit A family protein [candidate division KSB1 bacterium]|nr:MAG: CoB--CoM heterodisulfide reductase iron-sulfur subunit A family protein [candidate division KSB1 bacterium]